MKYLLIIATVIFTVCHGQSNQNSKTENTDSSENVSTRNVSTDSNQFYFPLEVFHDTTLYEGYDTFVNTWYSEHLFAMREPILYKDKSQDEIYRFTWLRTFHNPIVIRIVKHNNNHMLYWKLCNGAGGYDPGKLTIKKQKKVEKATWKKFKKRLDQIDFWEMKTNETELLGTDGSQWILEGKTTNKYHVVDRWTPNEKSKYYRCCDFLIKLTDLEINDDNKY